MFTILKWVVIIASIVWGYILLYPKIDSIIDIKKTAEDIKQNIHSNLRSNQGNDSTPNNPSQPNPN